MCGLSRLEKPVPSNVYLFVAALGLCRWELSLAVMSRGCSSCGVWTSHCGIFSHGKAWVPGHSGFHRHSMQAQLWLMGLFALWHVESSQTRHGTHVPCSGRQILTHCTTKMSQSPFKFS